MLPYWKSSVLARNMSGNPTIRPSDRQRQSMGRKALGQVPRGRQSGSYRLAPRIAMPSAASAATSTGTHRASNCPFPVPEAIR